MKGEGRDGGREGRQEGGRGEANTSTYNVYVCVCAWCVLIGCPLILYLFMLVCLYLLIFDLLVDVIFAYVCTLSVFGFARGAY